METFKGAVEYTEYLYRCPRCKETFMGAADKRGGVWCAYCEHWFEAKDHLVEGGE